MSRHNIRHLPVVRGERIAGCITTTNLIRTQTNSPVYLVGDIHKRSDADGLREVLSHIPDLVHQMAESGATAHNIGHIVSTLTDAATVRLIQIAEAALGPPPVPYAWAAAGSQGRHEQTAQSDQDNCLILDNAYDEALHGEYFSRLSKMVCDGLNTCGYVYCPGEMMAMTGQWRQPLATWKRYFSKWIEEPEPKALMLSSIFFDLRFVHGEVGLFNALQDLVMEKCAKNKIFLAYMAGNALTHQPPVGFFRNFVLIRGGDHNHTLDMKHTGVVPIIDLARVYALSAGVKTVNTHERLMQAMERKAISQDGAMDLRDALEFISLTRLRHQARKIRAGEKADNYLEPEALSSFERSHLKDAFGVVKTMQAAMANTYQAGRF
jgi:CBS domain-containing protein